MANESVDSVEDGVGHQRLDVYLIMAMLTVFSFVGIVGNIIVIYVYTRGKIGQQQTATVFIVSLAVGDLIASSLTMPFTMAFEFTSYGFSDLFTCRLYGLLLTSTIPFSSLVMVGIALDRYFCICHPFKRFMNVPRALAMVALFTAIACTYGTLGATMYNIVPDKSDPNCNLSNSFDDLPTTVSGNTSSSADWNDFFFINGSALSDYDYVLFQERNISTSTSSATISETVTIAIIDESDIPNANCRLLCDENGGGELIFQVYQNFNFGLFMLAVLIVSILYAQIYFSVAKQRKKKARMLKRTPVVAALADDDTQELKGLQESSTGSNGNGHGSGRTNNGFRKSEKQKNGGSEQHSKKTKCPPADDGPRVRQADERMRNLKMAFMLFIVTIVFVISFMPCIIILIISLAQPDVTTPGVLFYLYFMMNAANPVIYCFMNPNFRNSLRALFGRK